MCGHVIFQTYEGRHCSQKTVKTHVVHSFFCNCRQFHLTMRPPECLNMTSAPTCEDQKQAEARFIGWHHLKTTFRTPERISQLSVSHVRELFLVEFHEWPHLQLAPVPDTMRQLRAHAHAHRPIHTLWRATCVSLWGRSMHACVRACVLLWRPRWVASNSRCCLRSLLPPAGAHTYTHARTHTQGLAYMRKFEFRSGPVDFEPDGGKSRVPASEHQTRLHKARWVPGEVRHMGTRRTSLRTRVHHEHPLCAEGLKRAIKAKSNRNETGILLFDWEDALFGGEFVWLMFDCFCAVTTWLNDQPARCSGCVGRV